MSVTFAPHPLPQSTEFEVRFWCETDPATFDASPAADALAATHRSECQECDAYGGPMVGGVAQWPEFNLSTMNAGQLLRVLGLVEPVTQEGTDADLTQPVPQWSGDLDATDFLGRALLAGAVSTPDAGRPGVVDGAMVYCGTRAGYLDGRLAEARELAQYCIDHDLTVAWA